jgi:hypothetical protein
MTTTAKEIGNNDRDGKRASVSVGEEGVSSLNVAQNGGAEQKTRRTTTGMLTS